MIHTSRDLTCLYCGAPNDSVTGPEAADVPDAGDVILCAICGALSVATLTATRKVTPAEALELEDDDQIKRARQVIASTKQRDWQNGWDNE